VLTACLLTSQRSCGVDSPFREWIHAFLPKGQAFGAIDGESPKKETALELFDRYQQSSFFISAPVTKPVKTVRMIAVAGKNLTIQRISYGGE
jgi:hypothetical protein